MLSRLIATVALACLPSVAMAGNWTVLPFSQTIMMSIDMVSPLVGFTYGGQNGVGSNALMTTDGAQTWTSQPIADNTFMIIANAAANEKSAIISGIAMLSGSSQYMNNGVGYTNSSEPHVAVAAAQSANVIEGTAGEGFAVVGGWNVWNVSAMVNGVSVSYDGGATFKISNTGSTTLARYGSFPSPSTWFISMGQWPSNNNSPPNNPPPNKEEATFGFDRATIPFNRRTTLHAHGKRFSVEHHDKKKLTTTNNNNGWIGQIMRSLDAGETWDLVFSNTTFYFNEISCADVSTCIAVGENDDGAFIYRSQDSGETWELVYSEAQLSLMAVTMLSVSEIYVGGGVQDGFVQGHVLYSTDGGDTWTTTIIPDNYISHMSFPDSDHGFAVTMDSEQQSGQLAYVA